MKFNLSKYMKKAQVTTYNKMLDESRDSKDISDKNINLSIEKKNKDNTVPYNVQLDKERKESKNTIVEKTLNKEEKGLNKKRDDWDGTDIMPVNIESQKHDQKKYEAYKDAEQDFDTKFWDKYVGLNNVERTKVPKNVPKSQLHNHTERFDNINDSKEAKYDKMVMASLKDADAALFNIYATAYSIDRELTKDEKNAIRRINNVKRKLLAQSQAPAAKVEIKRDDDTNEYKVVWIENGKPIESKTYYTDDKDDAIITKKKMEESLMSRFAQNSILDDKRDFVEDKYRMVGQNTPKINEDTVIIQNARGEGVVYQDGDAIAIYPSVIEASQDYPEADINTDIEIDSSIEGEEQTYPRSEIGF